MNVFDYTGAVDSIKRIGKECFTFQYLYDCWMNHLVERAMRLLVIESGDVPSKEAAFCLLLNGSGAVTEISKVVPSTSITEKYKGKLGIFNGQYCGTPSIYYDIYEDYSVHSPIGSKVLRVDRDCVVIENNSCRTSIYPLVHRYASLIAHTEVSMVNTLVNGRDSGGIPIASTDTQRQSIINYRNSLFNGKVTSILDPAFSGVQFVGVGKNTTLSVGELMELRTNLLASYYADLGVKTAKEKRGNMIKEEVNANDSMLLLNISDMLYSWKKGFEAVNKKYGVNWTVELAPELDYLIKEGDDDEETVYNQGTVRQEQTNA